MGSGLLNIEAYLVSLGLNAPVPARNALYVYQGDYSVDDFFVNRLELLGFNVTRKDAYAVQTSDANGQDLIVVSHSIMTTSVGYKFKQTDVPLITWEYKIFSHLGMASRGSYRTANDLDLSQNNLTGDVATELAAYNGFNKFGYALVSSDATVLATVPGNSSYATAFTYQDGAQMYGARAPEKRAGLYFQSFDARDYTPASAAMFDTTVVWSTLEEQAATDKIWLEAEAPSRVNGSMFNRNTSEYRSGGAIMSTPNNVGNSAVSSSSLNYDLEATRDTYYVWLLAGGPDYSSDSFKVGVDGGTPVTVHTGAIGTSAWFKMKASYTLDGEQTLNIHARESGAWLDKILVTSDPDFVPTGLGGN